tara:strand:- start:4560 stop:5678 length:1119 start_codon:yes stop_codon:yes gene_type:complete
MKVCIITTGDIKTFATIKGATALATALNKKGHEASLILMNTENNKKRVKLECPNVKIFWFDRTNVLNEIYKKNQIIKNYQFDVIYSVSFGLRNFAYKMFNSKKFVSILEHSELQSAVAIQNNKRIRWLLNLIFEKLSLLLFSGHICTSRYLYNNLNKQRKKIISLYSIYAYSSDLISINDQLSNKLLKVYKDKKVLCYMGTLTENYGIFDVVSAIKKLQKTYTNFILLIIGSGKDKEKLLQVINRENLQNYVDIANYVPEEDLYTYLKNSDAFIAPLRNTTQDWARPPSKLFMYMHFNKPIITAKIGESKEVFSDYDFYYSLGEPESMSAAIEKALFFSDYWKPKWNSLDFSWDKVVIDRIEWLKKNWPKIL